MTSESKNDNNKYTENFVHINKCNFCENIKTQKYDINNFINEEMLLKYNIDPYIHNIKFTHFLCKSCQEKIEFHEKVNVYLSSFIEINN